MEGSCEFLEDKSFLLWSRWFPGPVGIPVPSAVVEVAAVLVGAETGIVAGGSGAFPLFACIFAIEERS